MSETRDISTREFGRLIGKSANKLVRWAKQGHPAAHWDSFRNEWRWIPEEYDRYIANCKGQPYAVRRGQRRLPYGLIRGEGR